MASTDNVKNTTPMYDLKTEPEHAAQPECELSSETERDPEDARGSIPGDNRGDATKLENAGPLDGGAVAWLVVLGAWCCSFSSSGWVNSTYLPSSQCLPRFRYVASNSDAMANRNALPPGVGSFQQYYEVGPLKNYSSSTIAWIPALQLFFLFALGPVVGIIFDNYGPRPLIIVGTLLHIFGLMMASLAKTYYQFILSQGVCSAIGVACLYTPGKFNIAPFSLSVLC
jgi:hypothetical protein